MDDDTFSSDSDSGSSFSDAFTGGYLGSSMGSGRSSNNGGCAALIIAIVVLLVVVAIANSGEAPESSERRRQQTKVMIDAWAKSMGETIATNDDGTPGYSCKHEKSRALCDVRLVNGTKKHLSCGRGGCSER